jgi:hypothetical protein
MGSTTREIHPSCQHLSLRVHAVCFGRSQLDWRTWMTRMPLIPRSTSSPVTHSRALIHANHHQLWSSSLVARGGSCMARGVIQRLEALCSWSVTMPVPRCDQPFIVHNYVLIGRNSEPFREGSSYVWKFAEPQPEHSIELPPIGSH